MKKHFLAILIATLVVSLTMAACNTKPSGLKLDKESISLELYEEYVLTSSYNGNDELTWSSSDTAIATVDANGKVVAKKAGEATITAKAGSLSATCKVVVSGYDETLFKAEFDSSLIVLYAAEEKQTNVVLKYDGEVFNSASGKTFESSDTAVATVDENGKITAVSEGTAKITVNFTVNGKTIQATTIISVQSKGSVSIDQKQVTLYALASGTEDNTKINLSATACEKGVPVEGATIAWAVNGEQDVISLSDNGVVTAKNAGKATVTATYTNADGEFTDSVEITVLPIEKTVEDNLVIAKNRMTDNKYTVDLGTIITGETATLNGARVKNTNGDVLSELVDGKIDFASIAVGEMKMVLDTRNIIYNLNVELFDVAIKDVEEFKSIENETTLTYCLENDLDFSSIDGYKTSTWFCGTFDGKGHKVTGLNIKNSEQGLFSVLNGATIKNLSVIDAVLIGSKVGAISYAIAGNESFIENVYVSVKSIASWGDTYVGGLVGYAFAAARAKNCFVYLPENTDSSYKLGYVCGSRNEWATANDCVFVGGIQNISGAAKDGNNDKKIIIENTPMYTALEAHKNKEALGSFYEAYYANHPYKELNSKNFNADTVKALTSEIVELTEDVDLTGYAGAGDGIFSGVFEGNGHKITGISFSSDKKGIFNIIAGALIKNVKIIDAALNSGTCGTIAFAATTTASTIKNVYVSVKTDTDVWSGGLVGYMYTGLNISNCCVDFINLGSGCSHGYVTGRSTANNLITLNDCVFIGGKGNLCGRPADSCKCESEYIKVTDTTDKTAMATALAKLEEIGFKSTYEENHSTTND